ncbi:MAG: hypothetical protein ACJATT_002250 [Myxococcota bacterium]
MEKIYMRFGILIVLSGLLAGCGGAPDGTTNILDLTAEEITTVCEEQVAASTPETLTCDETEYEVEAISQTECEANFSGLVDTCEATLDDYDDCVAADFCEVIDGTATACDPYFECFAVES